MIFESGRYRELELFALSYEGKEGSVSLLRPDGTCEEKKAGIAGYRWIRFSLQEGTSYEAVFENTRISLAYLSDSDDLMEEGIRLLLTDNGKPPLMAEGIYRDQYHFAPPAGWMNDPNGLCWYRGRYHMFYQYNPHGQEWNNMYWGHAVSRNLVHWTLLPVVLEPQEYLLETKDFRGGAFSGSAWPEEDKVVFALTRNCCKRGEQAPEEIQTVFTSQDMIHFEKESLILNQKPDGAHSDWRDPKIWKAGGKWYLVLGGGLDGYPAIFFYGSHGDALGPWKYKGVLLSDREHKGAGFECPDFFQIGDMCVAVGALFRYTDKNGRYQPIRYYLGKLRENLQSGEDLNGEAFAITASGMYDFGGNFYAVQSFEGMGRRIAIGWIADFYKEHRVVRNGVYGSMSIPRELSVRENRLYMKPVKEIYHLKEQKLYEGSKEEVLLDIPGKTYYCRIEIDGSSDFSLLLGRELHGTEGSSSISLIKAGGPVYVKTVGTGSEHIRFYSDVVQVQSLEIFVDRRTVEVFLNDGEAAASNVFYSQEENGRLETAFVDPERVRHMEVWTMESIWKERR
ncbi:GH32 C-terminal domain-containing protein [Lachnospiraceae bacterium 62-35]